MASKHAHDGVRRVGDAVDDPRTRAETAGEPRDTTREASREPAPATAEIETNALSGPIAVPRREPLGDAGFDVHPLTLGAGAFGRTVAADDAADILDRFAALGGILVDTADGAADGRSERIVGEWMGTRGTRDRLRVMTRLGGRSDRAGPARPSVTDVVDASLDRLGTDRIDLLVLHDDDPDVPLEERLGAIDVLVTAGKVLAIGAADFSPERLIEARVLAANGLPRFQVLSARYSLMERRAFEGAPELVAHAQGLAVLPHAALADGFLGGRVRRRSDLRRDARGERQSRHLGRRGLRVLRALDEIAAAHGTVPAAVAVAWLLARPTVVAPIAGVSRPAQVDPLMGAASLILHRSELVELDRASS